MWVWDEWMIFPENMWEKLCLDEKDISGSVYTILSNPGKDKIVAILPGTKSKSIIESIIAVISKQALWMVKQICTDMSPAMECIINALFPFSELVTDRFHVMKNLLEDLSSVRIRTKSKIKNQEATERKKAKERGEKYKPKRLRNWETFGEAISRVSRQMKKRKADRSWKQRQRRIVMQHEEAFSELIEAYNYMMRLRKRYDNEDQDREIAEIELTKLIEKWEKIWKRIIDVDTMAKMLLNRKESICNYFIQRHTNGYAEWLNSRISKLVSMSKWFADKDYMLYRITTIFA